MKSLPHLLCNILLTKKNYWQDWLKRAMFSPTELLKLYVKEAFNREDVPAPSWKVHSWQKLSGDGS